VTGMVLAVMLGHTSWVFISWGSVTACLLSSFFFVELGKRFTGVLRAEWRSLGGQHRPHDHPAVFALDSPVFPDV
jgi:hypothetical protein